MGRPDTATILRDTPASTAGGWSSTYVAVGTTACRLTPASLAPAEMIAAAELASITRWFLNVPPGTDIRPRDRVTVQGTTFEVLGGYQPGSWNIADIHILAEVTR